MKSMLRFFPALLAVWPYGILCIGLFEEDARSFEPLQAMYKVFLWVYCGLSAALLLFQILYCCLHRASARTFAFWNLTVKLCHIPFYLAVFALGVLMTMAMVVPALLFVSPAVNLAVDTALMLTSSAYGIRAAVSGVREGRLSIGRAVLLGVLHLFFVFDVIGAAVEYAFFRAADSKNKLQQEGIHS